MSTDSSSFEDIPPLSQFSNNSSFHPLSKCLSSKLGIYVVSAFSVTYILLLPLSALVLYLGYQRWRKQRSTSTPISHSDLITYHCVFMQLNESLGVIVFLCGSNINIPEMIQAGTRVFTGSSIGQAVFHLLTCVEHYLAVVHPITYRRLRQARWIRIRNISIGCVWFLSFGCVPALYLTDSDLNSIWLFCASVFLLVCVSFCCISVLCALKRPGPGEVSGSRERVEQSKQRAFHTILAIMGILLLKFGGNLIANVINSSAVPSTHLSCVVLLSLIWNNLPSTLVLPLLFLHRAKKSLWCKKNTESAGG